MPENHYGILVPAIQPPTGVLDIADSDWEPLRSIVREKLDERVEIPTHRALRVLLLGGILEVPTYLVRVWTSHPLEDIAAIVRPELVRIADTHIEAV
jgi:hypothetical protein